jgi:ABC-type sugar transport system ATPase subunit
MVALHLKNVTKHYGQQIAVNALSLTVPHRRFLSLVGPSGCGKTTTLRVIAALERSPEGEIWFGEERGDHLAAIIAISPRSSRAMPSTRTSMCGPTCLPCACW